MDGHFVPNLTIGPPVVEALRRATPLPLDVHLMIEEPERSLAEYAAAGADRIGVHVETCPHLHRTVQQIRGLGKKACVVLNPATPAARDRARARRRRPGAGDEREPGLRRADVHRRVLPKLAQLRRWIDERELAVELEVDGGIAPATIGARRARARTCSWRARRCSASPTTRPRSPDLRKRGGGLMRALGLLLRVRWPSRRAAPAETPAPRVGKGEDASLSGRDIYQCVLDNRFASYVQDAKLVSGDRGEAAQESRLQMTWSSFRDEQDEPAKGVLSKTIVRYTHPFDLRFSGYLVIEQRRAPERPVRVPATRAARSGA